MDRIIYKEHYVKIKLKMLKYALTNKNASCVDSFQKQGTSRKAALKMVLGLG